MLKNVNAGNTVYLDYDFKFESMRDGKAAVIPGIVERLTTLKDKLDLDLKYVLIRPSGRGNTHIALIFEQELDILNMYVLRAAMKEDVYRLMLDQARYFNTGDPKQCNMIWSTKVVDGVKYTAGEWHEWNWRRFL